MKIVEVINILIKYRKFFIVSTLTAFIIAFSYSYSRVNLYESHASIVILPATPLNNFIQASHAANLDIVGTNIFQNNLTQSHYLMNVFVSYDFYKYIQSNSDFFKEISFEKFKSNIKILNPNSKGIIKIVYTDSSKERASYAINYVISKMNSYLRKKILDSLEEIHSKIAVQLDLSANNAEKEILINKLIKVKELKTLTNTFGVSSFEILSKSYEPSMPAGISKKSVFLILFFGIVCTSLIILIYSDEYLKKEENDA